MAKHHFLLIVSIVVGASTHAATALEPATAEAQVAELDASCAGSAEARLARQTEKPLFIRLGEYDRIRRLTGEIVRLHLQNDAIKHLFAGVDHGRLAQSVADFMAAGSGGETVYHGRDMRAAHAHLNLTNADFLAAGGDVGQAMQNLEYGAEEIEEVVCILVSLRADVVL